MKMLIYILTVVLLSRNLMAFDEFNSYRWNRKNIKENNGKIEKGPWFEWWYYKVVLPEKNRSFFFVYGVVNPWDLEQKNSASRSQISMGDFEQKEIYDVNLPVRDFKASYDTVYVNVAGNEATDTHFKGSVVSETGNRGSWDIAINKIWTFNSTGWATGKGITNVEWYPAQASANCSGKIESKGEIIEFTDAPCYQDRNWGDTFPKWWTWIVSNHFENSPGTALAIGGGWPKFGGIYTPIKGVAIGLWYQGKEYTFRPNDLNPVWHKIDFGTWKTWAENGNIRVEIEADAPRDSFMDLQFTTPDGKIFHDYETLSGSLTLKILKKKKMKWQEVETLTSRWAGIEYGSEKVFDLESLFLREFKIFR